MASSSGVEVHSISQSVEALQTQAQELSESQAQLEEILSLLESEIAELESVIRASESEEEVFPTEQVEFFEKKIRPVLISNCFECHGAEKQKGGLRLDSRTLLLQGGDTGQVIDLQNPEQSRLLEAISYSNLDLQMPPRSKLADHEIADLNAWVRMGAPWLEDSIPHEVATQEVDFTEELQRRAKHWAFQPLQAVELPQVKEQDWVRNEIDAFILSRLEGESIPHAETADRRTLIRRLYYDLIGLPPTPREIEEFVHDANEDVFPRWVDRLLDSPHFGERWGRRWLDLVRYAETDGHEFDQDKPNAWRYRDYVTEALSTDLPYDRFVLEHIAGDLLETPRISPDGERNLSEIATGFYWLGEIVNSPVDPIQAHTDRIDNQIDVLGKAFLGLTVSCARCHDHKFDPISTADYYALSGFLHSSRPRQAAIESKAVEKKYREAAEHLTDIDREIESLLLSSPEAGRIESDNREKPEDSPEYHLYEDFLNGASLEWTLTGNAFNPGPHERPIPLAQTLLGNPFGKDSSAGYWSSRWVSDRAMGIALSPIHWSRNRYVHIRMAGKGKVNVVSDEYRARTSVVSTTQEFKWHKVDIQMYVDKRNYIEIVDDNPNSGLIVDQIWFSDRSDPPPDSIGESKVNGSTGESLLATLTPDQRRRIQELQGEQKRFEREIQPLPFALATTEDLPQDTPLHIRGSHKSLGDAVPRRFLEVFSGTQPMPIEKGSGRLELARSLIENASPLLARVMVNRIWTGYFGRGLVSTPDDFGHMGEKPTHPALLDLLAKSLIDSNWSLKSVHRTILGSNAYRMVSRISDIGREKDPQNKLVHRMPVKRLEAESMRDAILAVSGQLDRRVGGPSVKPFLTPFMDGRGRPKKSGPLDGDGRRSLYINVRRNFLPPLFLAFDFPSPNATIGKRGVSNVPSQALTLLNNEFVIDQASKWSSQFTSIGSGDAEERLRVMYQQAFGRNPTPGEIEFSLAFVQKHPGADSEAWTDLAHVIVNLSEFVFVR